MTTIKIKSDRPLETFKIGFQTEYTISNVDVEELIENNPETILTDSETLLNALVEIMGETWVFDQINYALPKYVELQMDKLTEMETRFNKNLKMLATKNLKKKFDKDISTVK